MNDIDRLAELLHAEWDRYRACEPSEPGAPCHYCICSATRLIAAGVTLAPTPPDALAAMRPIILDWMANTKWCIAHDMQPNGKCRDPEHYHGFEADDLLTAIAAGVTLDPRPAPDAALREAEQLAEAFTATWGWSPTHAWQQAQRVVAALKEKS